MRVLLHRVGVGLYLGWLVVVVLLALGTYTPVPLVPGVEPAVTAGAVALTALGAVVLLRNGARRLRTWLD